MPAVLLTRDLMVVSRVEGNASSHGFKVRTAADAERAVELCAAEHAAILMVDLSTPSLDIESLVAQVQTTTGERPRIVAFGPHVHADRLAAARNAGCDEVVSRGEFFARLGQLLPG